MDVETERLADLQLQAPVATLAAELAHTNPGEAHSLHSQLISSPCSAQLVHGLMLKGAAQRSGPFTPQPHAMNLTSLSHVESAGRR